MTDTAFDRSLRDWLEAREPGPVPASLRESASRVPLETPIPAAARAWQAIVAAGATGRRGSPLRLVLVLALLGLLLAAVAAILTAGSRPAPLTTWHDYEPGKPAPDRDFGSIAGSLVSSDATISVDDLTEYQFVVVLYFPGDAPAGRTAQDAGELVAASEHAPSTTAFLVIASPSSHVAADTVERLHAAGAETAEPPPDWPWAGRPQGDPVLVITNRRGIVSQVYVGDLPAADLLIGDLDRASVQ